MSEKDDKDKRPWRRRNPFFDLFSEFDKMDSMMDEMLRKAFEDTEKFKSDKPMVYGFSMKMGPDGKPQLREFGNLRPEEEKVQMDEAREPLVDVIERDDEIDVLAELPGVSKEDIQLDATDHSLRIEAGNEFQKTLDLPAAINPEQVKAEYKNGVLTVTLSKKEPQGKKVDVE